MLEIRPNCELCNKDLPAASEEAMICSYECTFCVSCVTDILENVCPNCGGGLHHRPIRPTQAYRDGISLKHQRPSDKRVHTSFTSEQIREFALTIKSIPYPKR